MATPASSLQHVMGNYDKIIRDNLGQLNMRLMQYLLDVPVGFIIPLPAKIKKTVIEKEVDGLFLVKTIKGKPFIVHLEYQSTNDKLMVYRMAAYDYFIQNKYKGLDVMSIVVYVGRKKMNMVNSISFNKNHYSFDLIDIRDLNPELFLNSGNAKEIIFALLTGRDNQQLKLTTGKIITRLSSIVSSASELSEVLEELEIISSLRGKGIEKFITKQKESMPIIIDIRKTLRYKEAKAEGKIEGKIEGIEVATRERNIAFVLYLLEHTGHSIAEIAKLVNVTPEFVEEIKHNLTKG